MGAPADQKTQAPADTPPTRKRRTPVQWARRELFSSWWNTLLTLLVGPLVLLALLSFLRFVFVTGTWEIVEVNLTNLMVGRFPRDELWRIWLALGILALAVGAGSGMTGATAREAALAAGRETDTSWPLRARRLGPPLALVIVMTVFVRTPLPLALLGVVVALGVVAHRLGFRVPAARRGVLNVAVLVAIVLSLYAITGFGGVPRALWGGALLTAYYTLATLVIAFPLGIVIALGRRSSLPVVRGTCMTYIEFFRGSPLIVLLFIGWLVLPFFLPPGFPTPDRPSRALVIFILFTSAYVAEIVRGGLQGVPHGQVEAAQAVGLSPWRQTRLVVLPQALRSVIPALVGQAISLFKDTPLVLIIGQQDLLRVAATITQQPQFRGLGLYAETLTFAALIYWVASYWLSRESQRLEARLGVGTR